MNEKECELLLKPNEQRLDYYKLNINDLKDIDFVYFDCMKANIELFHPTQQYSKIEILPLADYEHIFLLNNDTYNKYDPRIRVNTEILFDSNIFGKMKIDDAWDGDIAKLKEEIKSKNIPTNAIPFILERTLNDYDYNSNMQYRFYEDFEYYFKHFSDCADESNIKIMADNAYNTFIKMRFDNETRLIGDMQHFASYAYLLKTFSLYNKYSSADQRIDKFANFINKEIFVYLELTANLCIDFLINGSKSIYAKFFKYFQINYPRDNYDKLIKSIKGMAWDLTLTYNSMRTFVTTYKDYHSLCLIYFATGDNVLAEIIKKNKIRALSIKDGEISQMYFENGLRELQIDEKYKNDIAKYSDYRKNSFERMNRILLKEKLEEDVRLNCK